MDMDSVGDAASGNIVGICSFRWIDSIDGGGYRWIVLVVAASGG